MTRCPRCRGNIFDSDGTFVSCVLCGETIRDEPTLLDKLESNATPEWRGEADERVSYGPRLAIEAPSAVTARVISAIRRGANGG